MFKVITAEGHGISAVEAAIEVSAMLQHRKLVAERDISAIHTHTQRPAVTNIDKTGPLRNNADRDHSLQYMVAVFTVSRFCLVDSTLERYLACGLHSGSDEAPAAAGLPD